MGRNEQGWQANDQDWRKKRTLYCYSEEELQEISSTIKKVDGATKHVGVIFNNNSGGDAAEKCFGITKNLRDRTR